MPENEALLKQIRDRYDYHVAQWEDIRDDGRKDMKYLSGDPWDEDEKRARKESGRPCIALDELNQYLNQLVNGARQTRRAIKVTPRGNGASDKTAEFRAGLIRQIEYKSKASSAYLTSLESCASRSYGFFRVSKRYVSDSEFDQELFVRRVPNPNTILVDPDAQERDASDMRDAFVLERFSHDEFRSRWPKAEVKSFTSDHMAEVPSWVREKDVLVAEYWRRDVKKRKLLLVDGGNQGQIRLYQDELTQQHVGLPILKQRTVEESKVVQRITNGLEILEENQWDGKYIPIVAMFGREMWVDYGSGDERKLLSLVRLARDPYMLYCYYRTCQQELAGQVPKAPWEGYEGQFEGHEDEWTNAHRVPIGFLQAKPVMDSTGTAVLPLPKRTPWDPSPIIALDQASESARRAIQAAMGISPLPTAAQRQNEKSGIALERIESTQERGSYHFIEAYEDGIAQCGRIIDDLIPSVYDAEDREIGLIKPNDEPEMVRINTAAPYIGGPSNEPQQYRVDEGDHDVTISTGSSFESQRQEASEFADALSQNPQIFPMIADLVVKLKNIGPIGDEISKRLAPPDQKGQQGQMNPQQIQALAQQHEQLTAALNEANQKLEAKTPEIESKERIEAAKLEVEKAKIEAELKIAEMQAAVKSADIQLRGDIERLRQEIDVLKSRHAMAHEAERADIAMDREDQRAAETVSTPE